MLTVNKSDNRKTGPIAVTYRGKTSCPLTCGAFNSCYAKSGFTGIQFVNAGIKKTMSDTVQLVKWMMKLPIGRKLRHHVAGDFMTEKQRLDKTYIRGMIRAHKKRPDLKAWLYTHAWNSFKVNPFKDLKGLVANASCDNLSEIKPARDKGFDTVVIVPENFQTGIYDKERIVVCPAQSAENITCDKCNLCSRSNRNFTIGFRIHGAMRKNFDFLPIAEPSKLAA